MTHSDDLRRSFIGAVQDLAGAAGPEGLRVGEIVDRLDERAFGLLLLMLTLPCLVPGLPGAQVIAVAILLLSMQLMVGRREPWLPRWFLNLNVRKTWIDAIADFSAKRLAFVERVSKPRLLFLAHGVGERIVALFMALAAVTVMAPITNTIPSIGLTLCALALIERDGLLSLAGMLICAAWFTLLAGIAAVVFFGSGVMLEHLKDATPFLDGLWEMLPGR